MNFAQVLERISKIYPAGAIEYYARCKPDPWQGAHDKLEWILTHSPELKERAIDQFGLEIEELCERFRKKHSTQALVSMATHFHSESPAQALAKESTRTKSCVHCDSTRDLTIIRREGVITPICKNCRQVGKKTHQAEFF